jgi:hypothetical protein
MYKNPFLGELWYIIMAQIQYLGIWVIRIAEIKLLMLPSDRLLMTSRLATVGRAYPRKHIRGSASCLVTWNMWQFSVGYFSIFYIYKNGCMCSVYMCVCSSITLEHLEQFQPNLVHIWLYVCMYKNFMYIYLLSIIFSREGRVGGHHGIHPQGLPIASVVTFTQIGIEATAR